MATASPPRIVAAGDGTLDAGSTTVVAGRHGRRWASTVSLGIGALAWEVTSRLAHMAFMPPIETVLRAAWRLTVSGEIPTSLAASATALLGGYGLAVVVGVTVGLMLGRYRLLATLCDPYLDALLATPSLLLVPLFYGMFGLGRTTEIAVVFVYSFVVISVMARSGLATIDPACVDMARVFGASERQLFRRVLFPAALPSVMAGLRLGLGRAVRGLINAEMLVGTVGLGALLRRYGSQFDAASVYGILTILIALALVANRAMHVADERLNHWSA